MLRANSSSVLPPKFEEVLLRTLPVRAVRYRYRLPVTWDHVGVYLTHLTLSSFCRSVHCSKATSTIPSRRFPPSISSLRIRKLCTPPCRCISFMVLKVKFKYIIVRTIHIVNHVFLMHFNHNAAHHFPQAIPPCYPLLKFRRAPTAE